MDERREMGEEQSAPCADNSAASASAKIQIKVSAKVEENAEGSGSFKAYLMRYSDAVLAFAGTIIHGDHEYWGFLVTKQHEKVPVQSRCTRYLTKVLPSAHDQYMELSSEIISNWNKRGIVLLKMTIH